MSYRVKILPKAEEQVRELAAWWKENRPGSRTTLRKALFDVQQAIALTPFGFQLHP